MIIGDTIYAWKIICCYETLLVYEGGKFYAA
jgi:hypothetical protein